MSIRFRRSIKICKGLRVNLNKDSFGLSVGPRGLGYTFNSKGRKTFHVGIPGTGISYVDSNNISSSKSSRASNQMQETNSSAEYVETTISFKLEDDGKWKFFYPDGSEVIDQSLINRIKRNPSFIAQRDKIVSDRKEKIAQEVEDFNSGIDELIHINKMSAYPLLENQDYEKALNQIKLEVYKEEEYSVSKPAIENVTKELTEEAKNNVKSLKVWELKKRREEYVHSHLNERFEETIKAWKTNKEEFDKKEKEETAKLNREAKREYDEAISHFKGLINGDEEVINNEVEEFLTGIELPLEFNINYSYTKSNSSLLIDLDLPEIENMPAETAMQLASGMKKIKPKTKQELKDDYKQFVFGFALFLTSHLFNISPKINNIITSGYTQRRSKNGDLKDDYIYSIIFEREEFKKYNPIEDNTIYICNSFKNRCNVDMYSNFKSIEPYTSIKE